MKYEIIIKNYERIRRVNVPVEHQSSESRKVIGWALEKTAE